MKTDHGQSKYKRIKGHPIARPSMKETTLCPRCKYAVKDTWNYCAHCGLPLAPLNNN